MIVKNPRKHGVREERENTCERKNWGGRSRNGLEIHTEEAQIRGQGVLMEDYARGPMGERVCTRMVTQGCAQKKHARLEQSERDATSRQPK